MGSHPSLHLCRALGLSGPVSMPPRGQRCPHTVLGLRFQACSCRAPGIPFTAGLWTRAPGCTAGLDESLNLNATQYRSPQEQNTERGHQAAWFRSHPTTNQPCAGCQDLSQPWAPCQWNGVMAAPDTPPRTAGQPMSSEQRLAGAERPVHATSISSEP